MGVRAKQIDTVTTFRRSFYSRGCPRGSAYGRSKLLPVAPYRPHTLVEFYVTLIFGCRFVLTLNTAASETVFSSLSYRAMWSVGGKYKLQLFLSIKHHVLKTRGEVRLHTLSRSGLHGG